MKRIAVVCAPGIGDALILHIASFQLQTHGYEVVTFSNHLASFGSWLKGFQFAPQPSNDHLHETFDSFDAIFLQHDNSLKARQITLLNKPIYIFYGSHVLSKHGPLRYGYDYVCDQSQTMVDNILRAIQTLFRLSSSTPENGLKAPAGLIYRRHTKRAAIHPTSAAAEKNWPRHKFLELSKWLETQGYEPVFLAPPAEKSLWGGPEIANLEALASFIYESGLFIGNDSGPGHIASYLKIPHLIFGTGKRHMRFWRPGWMEGIIATPPSWIPNFKGFRLRERYWRNFITTKGAINRLKKNVL